MTRIFALSALALASFAASGAPALAEASKTYVSLDVQVPGDLTTDADKAAYTHKLMAAVERVCFLANSPGANGSYKAWDECLDKTALATAKKDPTGLLAAHLSQNSTSLAAAK